MINKRRGEVRGRRAFTPEFKAKALRVVREQRELGATLSAIGRELDMPANLLRPWARRANERDGSAAPAVQSGQQRAPTAEEEVRRLQRENLTLRQERDFLTMRRRTSRAIRQAIRNRSAQASEYRLNSVSSKSGHVHYA